MGSSMHIHCAIIRTTELSMTAADSLGKKTLKDTRARMDKEEDGE